MPHPASILAGLSVCWHPHDPCQRGDPEAAACQREGRGHGQKLDKIFFMSSTSIFFPLGIFTQQDPLTLLE